MIINDIDFPDAELNKAEWIDRGIFCDAYVDDVNGVSHNIQYWYCNDNHIANN